MRPNGEAEIEWKRRAPTSQVAHRQEFSRLQIASVEPHEASRRQYLCC
jgi:hypothetical protein